MNLRPNLQSAKPVPARGTWLVMWGSLCVALVTIGLCFYIFLGFIGDGRTWLGIGQAFALCFGVGGSVYLPALVLFFMARHARIFGPKRSIGLASVFISLPLWAYGGAALVLKLAYWPIATLGLIIGFAVLFWGISVMRHAKTLE